MAQSDLKAAAEDIISNRELRMAMTRAQMNKKVRQEALRDQLSGQGHVQHVVDSINKLEQLDEELDSTEVQRIRAAIDSRLKLVDKYLPSLKSIELTGDEDSPVAITAYEIRFSDDPED